jgi:hypothetical protein
VKKRENYRVKHIAYVYENDIGQYTASCSKIGE